jgi:hypothetical protein
VGNFRTFLDAVKGGKVAPGSVLVVESFDRISRQGIDEGYDLITSILKADVRIMTLAAFAPWKSENDSAEVMAAITPLNALTEAGFAVLLFHHHGKADQSEGRAARGSTALAGAVDVLLEMQRYSHTDLGDRRRAHCGEWRSPGSACSPQVG